MKGFVFRRIPLVLFALFTMTVSIALANSATFSPVPATFGKTFEEEILVLINKHRASIGLSPLTTHSVLVAEAEKHSRNMSSRKVPFGHKGFNDRMASIRKQVPGVNSAAENVAHGDMTAAEVVNAWLHSPEHKKNIEGNYRLSGIGIARDREGGYYFTQIFAGK